MGSVEAIARYLVETENIREISVSFSPLNPEEKDTRMSRLSPWSVGYVALNAGATESEVRKFVDSTEGIALMEGSSEDGGQVIVRNGKTPLELDIALQPKREIASPRVINAMNLHVYQFLTGRLGESDQPVKIEDAIFDLKNSLFLPDDFMPEHLMGMVEGISFPPVIEAKRAFQIMPGITSIYLYPEWKSDGFGRVRFLYPSPSGVPEKTVSNEAIREAISGSFRQLSTDSRYREFEQSRLLKSVVYNMTQKKSRELRRPVFDPRKVAALDALGIVEKPGDVPKIREEVSVKDLESIIDRAKQAGSALAREWHESDIELWGSL